MSDIFVSYAREDHARVCILADALIARGWSLWWDPQIRTGAYFPDAIEQALTAAHCVVVVWSRASTGSRWVRTEALRALELGKLIPLRIDDAPLPFEFTSLQTADLGAWNGESGRPEFVKLVADIAAALDKPTPAFIPGPDRRPHSRLIVGSIVAAVLVLLGYAALHLGWPPSPHPPATDVFTLLSGLGYEANTGLSAMFQPGDVIQRLELGPDGTPRTLARPVVFQWSTECFPGLTPVESAAPFPSTGTLGWNGLPSLAPASDGGPGPVAAYGLRLRNPRVLTLAKGDISGKFSSACVNALKAALQAGDKMEWFETVVESVVADGVALEIAWKPEAPVVAREQATDAVQRAMAVTAADRAPDAPPQADTAAVTVASNDERAAVVQRQGLVVLGYRARPMQAIHN